MHTIIKHSFSDITENCIAYCQCLEETLSKICRENENINFLVNLLFTDYEVKSKEWFMKKELERIIDINISADNDYFRHQDWKNIIHYSMSNPLANVITFITDYIQCSLNQKAYEEIGMTWAVKFTDNDIIHEYFTSIDDMKKNGFTNNAKDYVEYLTKFGEEMMTEKNHHG